nr:integrase domain-containing protein [Caballeronia mineralivorans]
MRDRKANGLVRSYVATEDKSWEAHNVDALAKIEEIARADPYVAVQLKLQAALGLCVEESFMLDPVKAVRDYCVLDVTRGTKGGRTREVPIEWKSEILIEAALLSNRLTESTIPVGRTKAQWRDHTTCLRRTESLGTDWALPARACGTSFISRRFQVAPERALRPRPVSKLR